jgi:hypothetical protein
MRGQISWIGGWEPSGPKQGTLRHGAQLVPIEQRLRENNRNLFASLLSTPSGWLMLHRQIEQRRAHGSNQLHVQVVL